MIHQANILLLLFGSLQGWLLSLWFLRNQKKKLSNLYFALFLIIIGLQLTFKVITKSWLMHHVHFAYLISYKLPYLAGPLLYLYVKARKENSFFKNDLLHFLPFALALFYAVTTYYFQWLYKYQFHPYTQAILQLISLFAYGSLSLRLGNPLLRNFIRMVLAAESIVVITLAVMVIYYGRFPDVRLLFLSLTFLIYWISYQTVSKPDLFFEREAAPVISLGLRKMKKYAHSSLKPEEAIRIETELHQIIATEKLFLDANLTIDLLSARLKTSRHHLSQVLNDRLGKSYTDYICELRLEEAKTRLSSPSNFRFTIAAIALDSGFSSVSAFNEVFKKHYQITPSKFRDQQTNKMSA